MKRREIVVLSCVVFFFIGAFAAFEYSKSRRHVAKVLVSTPQLQSVEIGRFSSEQEGNKQAIEEISQQIELHPKTAQYEAHYLNNGNLDFYHTKIVYNRAEKKLLWIPKEAPRTMLPPPQWSFVPRFPFFRRFAVTSRPYSTYIFDERRPVVNDADIHHAALNSCSLDELTNAAKKFHKPQPNVWK